ncbi:MAG: ABC transporter permease, partial [Deltaproteobacteria bacterium]
MLIYLQMAIRNLLQARRRTTLLGVALALVSMLLVILLTLSQGLADTMIGASTLLTSGHINVA